MKNLFLRMILNMRKEEVMLYDNLLSIQQQEADEVVYFLESEYQDETKNFPYKAPPFDPKAALWGAQTTYFSAQLILFRQNKPEELINLLPSYQGSITPASILSADLSLRFLPSMMVQLKLLDPEDQLIDLLEQHLSTWHYSAIGYSLELAALNFASITENPCLYQLYIDRVIEQKAHSWAAIPILQKGIQASLGWHHNLLWKDLNLTEK